MKKYLIAAAAAAFIAPAAHALTVDETEVRSFGFAPTELQTTLFFDGYSGSGTVSEIFISLFGEIDGTITVTNDGERNENYSATTETNFFYSSTDVNISGAPQFSATGGTGGFTSIGPGVTQIVPVTGSDGISESVTGGSIGAYLNPFSIDLFTVTGLNLVGGGGNLTAGQTTSAFGEVSVEYRIEEPISPIPLPAAAWMMLAALGSLLAFRRFSKT